MRLLVVERCGQAQSGQVKLARTRFSTHLNRVLTSQFRVLHESCQGYPTQLLAPSLTHASFSRRARPSEPITSLKAPMPQFKTVGIIAKQGDPEKVSGTLCQLRRYLSARRIEVLLDAESAHLLGAELGAATPVMDLGCVAIW
jgi:hypothetical protein